MRTILLVALALIAIPALAQDPLPPPTGDDEAIAVAVRVAKSMPQAFSLSRAQNKQFDRVVRALKNDRSNRANQIWFSLIQDILLKGGPLPNFDAMLYTVVRESFLEENNEVGQAADAVRFENERLRIIREEIALLTSRMQESTSQQEVDRLQLERMQREAEKQMAEQEAEKREQELERLARRLERLFDMLRAYEKIGRTTLRATTQIGK